MQVKPSSTREEFIANNLGLVHSCAARFRARGIEYDDLYAAGCLGIVKAYDNFDAERGFCFSTYAVPVILGEIKKLFRDGGAVKVSRSIKELYLKVRYTKEALSKKLGYEPPISLIAAELKVSPEQVAEAINAATPPLSLTPGPQDDAAAEFDIEIDSHEESVSDNLSLKAALESLSAQERLLVELRFMKGKTQSETAKLLNTTQVQISRKERKILERLRNKM